MTRPTMGNLFSGNGISLPVLLPMMKAMKDVLENE